jgi:hypothetical protein
MSDTAGGFYRTCSPDTAGAEWAEGIGYIVYDEQARLEGQAAARDIAKRSALTRAHKARAELADAMGDLRRIAPDETPGLSADDVAALNAALSRSVKPVAPAPDEGGEDVSETHVGPVAQTIGKLKHLSANLGLSEDADLIDEAWMQIEALARRRSGFAAGREADGWQPIETAPKFDANGKAIYMLGWCPDELNQFSPETGLCIFWWEDRRPPEKPGWYGDGDFMLRPNHWRPLPAPPASQEAGK